MTHAERQGWTVVCLYVDPAISGRKESRPAIDQLKRDAQRRRFRYALCYKVNRIGRNAKASYATADEIEQHGVVVVSATETFNRQTASGNLTFGMLVIFAQKVEYPGTHEPLVSQELWDAAAGIRQGRTTSPTTRHPDHEASDAWLSGLVMCSACGAKLWHRTGKRGNRGRYYRCAGYDHRTCDVRDMVPSARLEEQLHTALSQLVLPEELLPRIISEARALAAEGQETAEKPIDPAAVQAKLRRLGLVYADGVIDDETYRKERTRLQVLLAEAASAPPRLAFREEQALKILQNMVALVKAATTEELRDVVRALFTHIWVQNRVIHAVTPRAEVYPILAARSGVVWRVPDGSRTHSLLSHSQAL